jgi:hypothetical protein
MVTSQLEASVSNPAFFSRFPAFGCVHLQGAPGAQHRPLHVPEAHSASRLQSLLDGSLLSQRAPEQKEELEHSASVAQLDQQRSLSGLHA